VVTHPVINDCWGCAINQECSDPPRGVEVQVACLVVRETSHKTNARLSALHRCDSFLPLYDSGRREQLGSEDAARLRLLTEDPANDHPWKSPGRLRQAILHTGGSMAGHNSSRDHSGRRNEGKEASPAEQTSRSEEQVKAGGDPQKPGDDEIGAQGVANGEVGRGGETRILMVTKRSWDKAKPSAPQRITRQAGRSHASRRNCGARAMTRRKIIPPTATVWQQRIAARRRTEKKPNARKSPADIKDFSP
jgi:hypothetical protein